MDVHVGQLRALSATASAGTLEGAARALHVTPSAISQRLKALEVATGRVLLVRTKPVELTESGRALLRLAHQIEVLVADTEAELGGSDDARPTPVPIAVNADSLATWVLPALAPLGGSILFDIHREDQSRTSELLRAGTVMAAVTVERDPLPGCTSTRLGVMRYRPMAASDFAARWFAGGVTARALARAPVVVFDRDDDLQDAYLRRRGRGHALDPPVHHVPASADYLTAIRLGFGWGMLPDLQCAAGEQDGSLVDIDPHGAADVVLHWQQWRLRSSALDRTAAAVLAGARADLAQ